MPHMPGATGATFQFNQLIPLKAAAVVGSLPGRVASPNRIAIEYRARLSQNVVDG